MRIAVVLTCLFLGSPCFAQRGDVPGEVQAPPPADLEIPPAPVLSPADALRSLTVAPGFRVQLVAAEPLVHDPVAISFGPDGRLWVVEMSGFMPNIDGTGEDAPVGKIATLDDTDGDGVMDRRTVFLEGLVLPRAIAHVDGGVLVAEPPHLWFCRDTNGDGVADEKIAIATDYGTAGNPEHTANGLMHALDNWIYNAKSDVRFRYEAGTWKRETTLFRGQWGITQDDAGRIFYNDNSDPVRGDLLPADLVMRNSHLPRLNRWESINLSLAPSKATFPIRVTPGINRGYRMLGPDAKLPTVTAACGLTVYRGDLFPADFANNVIVCEPSGNLVQRYVLHPDDAGGLVARNPYAATRSELLASTDERFRPVNSTVGPDGALYIADMYRGVIQHRIFVTTYLRRQVEERGLAESINLGRIYRLVPENAPATSTRPALDRATTPDLIAALSHPNGWWRDTAQRLLVERRDPRALPALRELATNGAEARGRLHALWTLEGFAALDLATLRRALADRDTAVRTSALRLAPTLRDQPGAAQLTPVLLTAFNDATALVRLHGALALGSVRAPEVDTAFVARLRDAAPDARMREAILSGLGGRELEFAERLIAENHAETAPALEALAACVVRENDAPRLTRLFALVGSAERPEWARRAILAGVTPPAPRGNQRRRLEPLAAEPTALIALAARPQDPLSERAAQAVASYTWPGKPAEPTTRADSAALTAAQQALFDTGRTTYNTLCAACHLPDGVGVSGLARPLIGSPWVLGSEQAVVRIVLHGKQGSGLPAPMPPLGGTLDDATIAGAITYIRRAWGNLAAPVAPETVAAIRRETSGRDEPWREEELGRFGP